MTDEVFKNKGVNYFNVDGRVLIFKPTTIKLEEILNKDLKDLYLGDNPIMNDDCWSIPENKIK